MKIGYANKIRLLVLWIMHRSHQALFIIINKGLSCHLYLIWCNTFRNILYSYDNSQSNCRFWCCSSNLCVTDIITHTKVVQSANTVIVMIVITFDASIVHAGDIDNVSQSKNLSLFNCIFSDINWSILVLIIVNFCYFNGKYFLVWNQL